MINLKNRLKYYLPILCMSLFFSFAQANELEYQERVSEIIYNDIKSNTKKTFLTSLYKELLFTPIWTRENSLSNASKELFTYIKNDTTLDKNTTIYRDCLVLESISKNVYTQNKNIYVKVSLELKISTLYKSYTDYLYYGSINWGAFSARISNLMVNGVKTEWVLHRPNANVTKMLSQVAFGASLKEELDKALPTAYHYKELTRSLKRYLEIRQNGGWKSVVLSVKKLNPNRYDNGIDSLRERLVLTGDYIKCDNYSIKDNLYDKCLQNAVKKFQKRCNYPAD